MSIGAAVDWCLFRKAYGTSYCADETSHLRGEYAAKLMNWDAEKYRIALARMQK